MSDHPETELRPFKKCDVSKVLNEILRSETTEELRGKITGIINTALDSLLSELPPVFYRKEGEVMMYGMPNVSLRKATIRILLDALEEQIGRKFQIVLYEIGNEVGISFAREFETLFRKHGFLALDYETLIEAWLNYDGRAGLGEFKIESFRDTLLQIKIRGSFLVSEIYKNPHKHCNWLSGYIGGVIDELLPLHNRWVAQTYVKPEEKWLVVKSVTEERLDASTCLFEVVLMEENLKEARNDLFQTVKELETENWRDANISARIAGERALKEKLELEVAPFKETVILMRDDGLLNEDICQKVIFAYSKASRRVHPDKQIAREETEVVVRTFRKFVKLLELSTIPGKKREELKYKIKSLILKKKK